MPTIAIRISALPRPGSRCTERLRRSVLTIALLFIGALATLTVLDFIHNGLTVIGVLAIMIVVLFMLGIVGALRHPPQE